MSTVTNPIIANPMLSIPKLPLSTTNPAQWMYERLVRSIASFEKGLKQDEEIGARLVSFGNTEVIHIVDVGFWGPDLVTFDALNVDKRLRWSRPVGQFSGRVKLGSSCRQAASLSVTLAPYASSGVRPANVE